MSHIEEQRKYIDIGELAAQTGMSLSTIHRLKKQGQIPFYQPAGKGGKLLFPPDAIEWIAKAGSFPVKESNFVAPTVTAPASETPSLSRLSGPPPAWMKSNFNNIPSPMDTDYAT